MKRIRSIFFNALRLLALASVCAVPVAHADDYGDVSQLSRNGKLLEALTKADTFLATKPNDPQMRFLKGVIQRNQGKSGEAIATFIKLTEDYPELPEPYNNLAVLYAGQGMFDKARAALEMAIRTNPSYATAHENLGDIYSRLASQAYSKALQLDGANAAVVPKLALIHELFSPTNKGQNQAVVVQTPVAVARPTGAVIVATAPVSTSVASVPVKSTIAAANTPPASAVAKRTDEIEAAVHTWVKAWSSKDMTEYLGAYSKEFKPSGKQSRSDWEEERRQRITRKANILVRVEKIEIAVDGNQAVARFRQIYRAGALAVSSRKTLDFVKVGDQWKIVRESTGS
jgi:ketosteroid isomerase-like protein